MDSGQRLPALRYMHARGLKDQKHDSPGQRSRRRRERRPGSWNYGGESPERAQQGGYHLAQSLSLNLIHLIYSTKNREACLSQDIRTRLFAYQAGVYKQWDSPALIIGGESDHVHSLFILSKNHPLIEIVEEVKKGSSKWLKSEGANLASFHWQNGYGAFSVSQSRVTHVQRYIGGQEEHHRNSSFQEEFRLFLKRHRIQYDERYVWD